MMRRKPASPGAGMRIGMRTSRGRDSIRAWTALLLLVAFPGATLAQTAGPTQQPAAQNAAQTTTQGQAAPSAENSANQAGQPPDDEQSGMKGQSTKKPT